jgi:hypothetical protein
MHVCVGLCVCLRVHVCMCVCVCVCVCVSMCSPTCMHVCRPTINATAGEYVLMCEIAYIQSQTSGKKPKVLRNKVASSKYKSPHSPNSPHTRLTLASHTHHTRLTRLTRLTQLKHVLRLTNKELEGGAHESPKATAADSNLGGRWRCKNVGSPHASHKPHQCSAKRRGRGNSRNRTWRGRVCSP